ncbi:MAG: tetratricopeptide repeat protein, partial [Longimicrobiales bacterium]|nr:tetratricopeptide repeat protein [Longimicrobiales bacterium]
MPLSRWIRPLVLILLTGCSVAPGGLPVPQEPLALPYDVENPGTWDYFRYGDRIFEQSPEAAAEAFYWAERRDPTWASPIFARRLALLVEDPKLYDRYVKGHRAVVESPWAQQLDSLYLRALRLNPLLDRRLEGRALAAMLRYQIRVRINASYGPGSAEWAAQNALRRLRSHGPPRFRALLAEGSGRYRDAARLYGVALGERPGDVDLLADRGRTLFRSGNPEEAIRHLRMAIDQLRERDENELQPVYRSKAVLLHAIGLIQEARTDWGAARSAYSEALQEDLA